jgi:hypothetical protein
MNKILFLFAVLLGGPAAAEPEVLLAKLDLIRPTAEIRLSTVSAGVKESINRQIPSGAEPVFTDESLRKSAVGTDYSIIPIPAFIYSRNEGAWAGALTPIFRANEKGQIEDVIAPLYLHNCLIGDTFTVNYFAYRSATRQFHAVVSHASKVERTVDIGYSDTGFRDGRYIVSFQAGSSKSAFDRFYGFGNKAGEQLESNFAKGDAGLKVSGGVNFGPHLALVGTERLRRVSVENGVVAALPQTREVFASAPGIDGADVWGQRLSFAYDTRDNPLTPLRGVLASVAAEYDRGRSSGSANEWWRLTAEARHFLPHGDGRAVLVTHALIDALPTDRRGVSRQGIPFYERPTLGGETTLRGFGQGRFVGDFALLFNVEERVSVTQRSIMGNVVELELAPFLDVGRVGSSCASDGMVRNMQFNPGVGVRLLARPNIASRLDAAYGRDGVAVYVGLDYPF